MKINTSSFVSCFFDAQQTLHRKNSPKYLTDKKFCKRTHALTKGRGLRLIIMPWCGDCSVRLLLHSCLLRSESSSAPPLYHSPCNSLYSLLTRRAPLRAPGLIWLRPGRVRGEKPPHSAACSPARSRPALFSITRCSHASRHGRIVPRGAGCAVPAMCMPGSA